MKKISENRFLQFSLSMLALVALLSVSPAYAQNTTSTLRVQLTNTSGSATANVPVTIRHMPTGRSQTLTANSNGTVTASNLAVGGPYEVTIGGNDYAADVTGGIYLELDKTEVVPIIVRPIVEEIVVTAQAATEKMAVGVGRSFDRSAIDQTPTIGRDFTSIIARDPKIVVDNSVARGPAVSMAGQNYRYNSVTIDGIPQNDNFGLNKNASATSRTPISIDAIQAINVNLAPYDVSYGNFIGGNINIVTKSGTNEFHGTAYYYNTDSSLTGDKTGSEDIEVSDFTEDTYGFTFGGPIVKDKLFFFANYEKFETEVPTNSQPLSAISGINQADVDRVTDILKTEYGFDPGLFATTDTDADEKVLVKLDWYVNDDHRAVLSYQTADTDVLFDDFPTVAALNSNRYNINQELTAYSAQFFSNWTDRFTTEVKIGKKEVKRRDVSVDGSTNEFLILKDTANFEFGTILAGGDRFRHSNELDNESSIFRIAGDYVLGEGNHTLTAGWERESKEVRNRFLPFSKGLFVFCSFEDLESRTACDVVYGNSNTGVASDAEAAFTLDVDSFFVQDEWTPTDDLTLTFGLRYDTYTNDDPITENPNFEDRNGFSNGENLDGKSLTQPRFGFNWNATDRLTVRGGAGLFGGGSPLIILSNSYAGDGISRTFARPGFTFPQEALDAAVAALPSADAAFNALQPFLGVDPAASTDVIDPDYEILSTWKYSVGADYVFGNDWFVAADLLFSEVENAYDIYESRRSVIGTAPDGRPIYDLPGFGFESDFVVDNTDIGSGTVFTLSLAKSWDTRAGLFDMTLGYTHTEMDELRSYNRFITFETHVFDTGTDMNNPVEAPSRYETPDRITFTLSWQKQLFGDNETGIGLVYAGRTGSHYTHVFGTTGPNNCTFGGSALADCGAEADIAGSQLFYVPKGATDPIITGDPGFIADLNEWIGTDGCLSDRRGQIVTRNACETDWINIFSLRFTQEIKVGGVSFDLRMDIENVGNLINSDWGRVESYTAPSVLAPANVSIPVAGGPYELTPTTSYDPLIGADSIVSDPEIAGLPSLYRIQLGVRLRF